VKTFTALFPFCGLGAGARGFLDALDAAEADNDAPANGGHQR
jgi:hypothetical protein